MAENPYARFANDPPSGMSGDADTRDQTATTTTAPEQPPTTWRGAAKNVAAGVLDVAANVGNVISDPSAAARSAIGIIGGTAYDAGAHLFGYPPMSPEQRADLYGQPQPGQAQLPPEQQPLGSRVINAVDEAIPGQKAATLPATPTEAGIRAFTGGAGTTATLGPGGILPALVGGGGAVAGEVASQYVPDWLKPGVQLAGNVAVPAATGAAVQMVRTPVGLVDASKAALGKTAVDKYKIPIEASDLTEDPRFARTGAASVAHTAAKHDAWQSAVINEMDGTGSRFTTTLMKDTATRLGQNYDDVANRTTIAPQHADNLVHNDLTAIEANLDNVAGITNTDRAAIRKRLSEIVDTVQPNGTIGGAAYKALTETNSPLYRLANSTNSALADVGGDITAALRKAFNASASPADQALLSKTDYQYRIMKTAQDLVAKSQEGRIDPGEFMNKVAAASRKYDSPLGGMAYTGGGNLGELARIGAMINVDPRFAPKSSPLATTMKVIGAGAATVAPALLANPLLAAGAPAVLAAAYARGKYLPSDMARNTLMDAALNPRPSPYSAVAPGFVTGTNRMMRDGQ